jgi:hypothetical protein
MSVTLYEGALRQLLEDPDGPMGTFLREKSEIIVAEARRGAGVIMKQDMTSFIDYEIVSGDDGLSSIVGVTGSGRMSEYLAFKQVNEGKPFDSAMAAAGFTT